MTSHHQMESELGIPILTQNNKSPFVVVVIIMRV
jgi:hypothetical protein